MKSQEYKLKMRSRFHTLHCVSLFLAVNIVVNLLIAGPVLARFYTVAGPAEPNKIGQLLITFTGTEGKPEEKEFSVYYPNPKIPDPVLIGRTGHAADLTSTQGGIEIRGNDAAGRPLSVGFYVYKQGDRGKIIESGTVNVVKDLPPGTYDIKVESKPPVWYEGVEIAIGHTKVIDLPQTGRLVVQGKDAAGESPMISFSVYASGEREKYIASGNTWTIAGRTVELPPGTYDIKVALDTLTSVWYEGIEISVGQQTNVTVMDPSQTGRLVVKGPSMTAFDVYAGGEREKYIAHGNTWADKEDTIELQPGTYDIRINLTPEVWYEGIEITAGHTNVIDLPQTK